MPRLGSAAGRVLVWAALALAAVAVAVAMGALAARQLPDASDATATAASGDPARPNVVLISLDTVRPDHLGSYGYHKNTSPNLDKFASEGVRFSNVRAQSPWTLPSHMSLLTSMLPSHNNVYSFSSLLPEDVPTLAQLLKEGGYHTIGLVNDGQMKAHWGFDRGFDLWREFPALSREGSCENITREALSWLKSAPPEPFFLFLHYYDPHHPYGLFVPDRFREAMGATMSPDETERVIMEHRAPDLPFSDPKLLDEVINAYDSSIAWVDHEVGTLLEAIPSEETVVVIFSDHGEAFKEHGWTFHGATLYEEEIRVALMMRFPESREASPPVVVDDPVMLMDVAPTILNLCGLTPPAHYQGWDLWPAVAGQPLPHRLIPSETKAFLEGKVLNALVLHPLKLIYAVHDGTYQLYALPDEYADLAGTDLTAADALLGPMRAWVSEENYWMIYAKGEGVFKARLQVPHGQLGVAIPINFEFQSGDTVEFSKDFREVRWTAYNPTDTKALFVTLAPGDAPLQVDFGINGERRPDRVFGGALGVQPPELPIVLDFRHDMVSPVIERPFQPPADGFHIMRHRNPHARQARSTVVKPPDDRTLEQLRSLGYLQ